MRNASKASLIAAGIGSAAAFWLGDLYAATSSSMEGTWLQNLPETFASIPRYVMENGAVSLATIPLLAGFVMAAAVWVFWCWVVLSSGTFRVGEEHGSAEWMEPRRAARQFGDTKDATNNIILTRNVGLAMDQACLKPANQRARNVLVVGGTGSGKTFMYVIPNALQRNADMVFTDTKGDLHKKLGQGLVDNGYDVTVFNLKDLSESSLYNMLAYLRDEQDIIIFVRSFISITNGEEAMSEEAFWQDTTALLLMATIGYQVFYCPPADRNLAGLVTLLTLMEASEEDEGFESPFELLLKEISDGTILQERKAPAAAKARKRTSFTTGSPGSYEYVRVTEPKGPEDDFVLMCWRMLRVAAGKTLKSVIVSTNARLTPVMVPRIREVTMDDEMKLDELGEPDRKRAIFLVTADTTDAFSMIVAMMVWQVIHLSTEKADRDYGGCLPRPVHLICDEFYNLGRLSEMDHVITTIRSRNICMSIMLQSTAQLEGRYGKEEAQVIQDNCDITLFLGGKSTETTRMVSDMAGKQTVDLETWNVTRGEHGSTTRNRNLVERDLIQASEVGKLPRDKAILLVSGADPIRDLKYRADAHPRWNEVAGHEGSKYPGLFDYRSYRDARRSAAQ